MEQKKSWSNGVQSCMKEHSKILVLGLFTTSGLMYLWGAGHKVLASTFCFLELAGACLYWSLGSRDEIRSGQAVVLTGCDSGLGYSLALHCHSLGATVLAGVLQKNGRGAEQLAKEGLHVIELDVTKEQSVKAFGSAVRTTLKQKSLALRALVNNAGVMVFGEFEWQTEGQMRQQVEVNLLGTMRVTKEMMPLIRASCGRIIVVSSHCAGEPLPGVASYAASKAGVAGWATALRVELSKYGINVVSFVPGSFTRESNLLARQDEHFAAMDEAMTTEARLFYGDYFTRYCQYLSALAQNVEPQKLQNPFVYAAFEGALLDKYPSTIYKCEPWRYAFYHVLFKLTPVHLRDRLVQRFMQMPRWKDEDILKVKPPTNESVPSTENSETIDRELTDDRPSERSIPEAVDPAKSSFRLLKRNSALR